MLNLTIAIRVEDPDGQPGGMQSVMINEMTTIGIYANEGSTIKSLAETLGVTMVEANRQVLDRALSAAAQIAKDASAQSEQ